MDNLKEASEYAVASSVPTTYEIGSETYSSSLLHRIDEKQDNIVSTLGVSTLTGFVDYITNNRDEIDLSKTLIVIGGTRHACLMSVLNKDKNREAYIKAKAIVPEHRWGEWNDNENFVIGLQSKFAPTEDREKLMQYIGNMQEEQGVQTMDDGVSQKIVAKTGVATVSNVILPNPVMLKPFRTFQEIDQPESPFIFRVRKGGDCALFEADGGAWAIECRRRIKEYLEEQLDTSEIVIIG